MDLELTDKIAVVTGAGVIFPLRTYPQCGHWQRSSGSPFISGVASTSAVKDVKLTV
jgi:hypothetical protein